MRRVLLLLAFFLAPAFASGHMVTCGAKLPNGEELMFDLPPGVKKQSLGINVGRPHAFRYASVNVTRTVKRLTLLEREEINQDGERFILRHPYRKFGDDGGYFLTVNLPEIGLALKDFPINCFGFW